MELRAFLHPMLNVFMTNGTKPRMDSRYWMAAACCTLLCAGAMAAYVTHNDGHGSSVLQGHYDYAQRAFADVEGGQPLSSAEADLEPPKKQTESGVMPQDVTCQSHHVLAIRTSQEPVCVTPRTAEILAERGIIEMIIGPSMANAGTAPEETGRAQDGAEAGAGESRGAPPGDSHGTPIDTGNPTSGVAVSGNSGAITGSNATTGAADAVEGLEEIEAQTPHTKLNNTGNATAGPETETAAEPATNSSSSSSSASSTAGATDEQERRSTHQGSVSTIPASSATVVNFYVTDDDLNTASNAAETIPTEGLLKFAINGIPIDGPDTMTETGPDTGQFHVRLELPPTIDGRPITHNDVVDVTYIDQGGQIGRGASPSQNHSRSQARMPTCNLRRDGKKRIGHEFTLRIYEPDANTDSKEENRIPLNRFEFRSEGSIRVTLDHNAFDANRSHMVETGPQHGDVRGDDQDTAPDRRQGHTHRRLVRDYILRQFHAVGNLRGDSPEGKDRGCNGATGSRGRVPL